MIALALALASCDRAPEAPPTAEAPAPQGTPATFSQDELAAMYPSLSGLVAEARTSDVWKRFNATQQANLTVADNRLQIEATGDNPIIILPAFGATGHRFLIETIIESPTATTARMFYMVKGQTQYYDAQSQVVALQPGRNVVYFRFEDRNIIDPLRLDPGAAPGTYVIESMRAMELPAT